MKISKQSLYVLAHRWIKSILGIPNKCDICGIETAKRYHWSNKNHKYKKKTNDWHRLCVKCHLKWDREHNLRNQQDINKQYAEAHKGIKRKPFTKETREKMRKAKLGKPKSNGRLGFKWSEEMKKKMSESRKRYLLNKK